MQGLTPEESKGRHSRHGEQHCVNLTDTEKQGGLRIAEGYYVYEMERSRKIVCHVIF